MVVLPLVCGWCGMRIDLRSNQPMPTCPCCDRKMRPAGAVRKATEADLKPTEETSHE